MVRYIDSGARIATSALGNWLQTELTHDVTEFRLQSGFFGVEGLRVLATPLERLRAANAPVTALIGSNDGETVEGHVAQFADLIGLPRANGRLGVIYYAGAYFHPKVYHVRRADGSQGAYVGSANLTASGVSGLHVEAGVLLDTAEGDDAATLNEIALSIDNWFGVGRAGLEIVADRADVFRLTQAGILSLLPVPRPPRAPSSGGGTGSSRPRLNPLLTFPPLPTTATVAPIAATLAVTATQATLPVVTQSPPYPTYLLFAPTTTSPTSGANALTGHQLPIGIGGIIFRWNRDSGRHWRGAPGTANISLPVTTLHTLRFGRYGSSARTPSRPRAEFGMHVRYVSGNANIVAAPATTNVMAYGYEHSDPGNKDVRMIVPKPPITNLLPQVNSAGFSIPVDDDLALLEWPTHADPSFRLTAIQKSSSLYTQAEMIIRAATSANQLIGHVGNGACWLPAGVSPRW
ncbi:phospholipase D family protein [Mesorhizobium metallidurans]|uniref:phospholipase D family protein n=1 Tax=Mesorhizobium metallidurans TaxID=489722 RepID=UPI0012FB5F46|nr:phospholipase D family protein [Mesorhizobium metallidurans]